MTDVLETLETSIEDFDITAKDWDTLFSISEERAPAVDPKAQEREDLQDDLSRFLEPDQRLESDGYITIRDTSGTVLIKYDEGLGELWVNRNVYGPGSSSDPRGLLERLAKADYTVDPIEGASIILRSPVLDKDSREVYEMKTEFDGVNRVGYLKRMEDGSYDIPAEKKFPVHQANKSKYADVPSGVHERLPGFIYCGPDAEPELTQRDELRMELWRAKIEARSAVRTATRLPKRVIEGTLAAIERVGKSLHLGEERIDHQRMFAQYGV